MLVLGHMQDNASSNHQTTAQIPWKTQRFWQQTSLRKFADLFEECSKQKSQGWLKCLRTLPGIGRTKDERSPHSHPFLMCPGGGVLLFSVTFVKLSCRTQTWIQNKPTLACFSLVSKFVIGKGRPCVGQCECVQETRACSTLAFVEQTFPALVKRVNYMKWLHRPPTYLGNISPTKLGQEWGEVFKNASIHLWREQWGGASIQWWESWTVDFWWNCGVPVSI